MPFAPEMYPCFEEARDATVEHPEVTEALAEYLTAVDRWSSPEIQAEAAISLASRIKFIFEREKNRAKDCTDEDAHAEYLGAS